MNRQEFQIELTKFLAERLLTGELALRREIPPPPFRGLGAHAERSAQRYYKAWQKVPKKVERSARITLERNCECVILHPGATWRAFLRGRRAMSWQLIHHIISRVCDADYWVSSTKPDWGLSKPDYSKAGRRKVRHRLIEKARKSPAAAVQDWLMAEIMGFKHLQEIAFTQFFDAEFYRRVRALEVELDDLIALMHDSDPLELRSGMLYEVLAPAFEEVE